ncbi:MAG: FeoA family protein [Sarcina sp.]
METLDLINVGESVVVRGLDKTSTIKRRLLEMGVTPGIEVTIVGCAPMGDPINIELRGYKLTLRKQEAHAILV